MNFSFKMFVSEIISPHSEPFITSRTTQACILSLLIFKESMNMAVFQSTGYLNFGRT
jgi:hypothetical protein